MAHAVKQQKWRGPHHNQRAFAFESACACVCGNNSDDRPAPGSGQHHRAKRKQDNKSDGDSAACGKVLGAFTTRSRLRPELSKTLPPNRTFLACSGDFQAWMQHARKTNSRCQSHRSKRRDWFRAAGVQVRPAGDVGKQEEVRLAQERAQVEATAEKERRAAAAAAAEKAEEARSGAQAAAVEAARFAVGAQVHANWNLDGVWYPAAVETMEGVEVGEAAEAEFGPTFVVSYGARAGYARAHQAAAATAGCGGRAGRGGTQDAVLEGGQPAGAVLRPVRRARLAMDSDGLLRLAMDGDGLLYCGLRGSLLRRAGGGGGGRGLRLRGGIGCGSRRCRAAGHQQRRCAGVVPAAGAGAEEGKVEEEAEHKAEEEWG